MPLDVPSETVFYIINLALFGALGVVVLIRSISRGVFSITWMGSALISFSVYYLLISLNTIGIIPNAYGFLMEGLFFGIILQLLIFSKKLFYKNRSRSTFIILATCIGALGVVCSVLAAISDDHLYNGIFDMYDVWRYAIDDFIVGPPIFLMLCASSVRANHRARSSDRIIRRRLHLFAISNLSIQVAWILNFVAGFCDGTLYEIFTVATAGVASFNILTLYLGWLTRGATGTQRIDIPAIMWPGAPHMDEGTRVATSMTIFRILEILGNELAARINHSPSSCMGLLMMAVLRQFGEQSISRLDIAKLPIVFDGELRDALRVLHVANVDSVVASMKAYFYENYDILSLGLY